MTSKSEHTSPVGLLDDAALVELAQADNYRAFDELVTRYRGKIYAMIYNMVHNQADAWDLSQDTFLKAWKGLPKFQGKSSFWTWLYRVAHNVTYDFLRKKKLTPAGEFNDEIGTGAVIDNAPTVPQGAARPDDAMHYGELRGRIEKALDQLSEEHREVIVLKEFHGMKYEQIAQVTESKIGTVMSRIYHARKKLQKLLADLR